METAQSVTMGSDGSLSTGVASKFDATVTRTGNRWDFAEEMCWSADGAEDVCSEAAVSYEIEGDSLFIIMGESKVPVVVVPVDEDQLGMTLKTDEFEFQALIGVFSGVLVQDGFTKLSDGTTEYQSLRLIKQ